MSEYYGGDDNGYYDENDEYNYYNGNFGGPPGSGGGGGPVGGGLPTSGYGGAGGDGSYTPPSGGGNDYYFNPFPPTGGIGTGGGATPPGTINTGGGYTPVSSGGNSVSNNTQNNTQNNSNVLAQSVGLGAVSPISSGVPQSPASSFKPNVISPGGGLHEGAPPPMPTPHAQVPPSLHPEKPTDWSKITFGAASSPQANPAGQRSTIGKIGGAIGQLTGMGQAAQRYKGIYDSLKPKKTQEEMNAELYRETYGL